MSRKEERILLLSTLKLKFFITGGTIDNLEYDSEDKAPKGQESLIPDLLKTARITLDYDVEVLLFKDSRFINDEDRELILQKCKECPEDKIIIAHGTLTMPVTAKYLGKKSLPKTIVLLGSAIPGNKPNSDALFNIGAAVSAAQLLPKGVYIAMNGRIFSWDSVKKESGYFQEE